MNEYRTTKEMIGADISITYDEDGHETYMEYERIYRRQERQREMIRQQYKKHKVEHVNDITKDQLDYMDYLDRRIEDHRNY